MAGYRLHSLYRRMGLLAEPGSHAGRLPSPIWVFLGFVWSRLRRRRSRDDEHEQRLASMVSALGVAPAVSVVLRGGEHRWHVSGIDCEPGEQLLLLATGRLWLSTALDVSLGVKSVLWYRFGEGVAHKAVGEVSLITADSEGMLALTLAAPGDFVSPRGDVDARSQPPLPLYGNVQAAILKPSAPRACLQAARRAAPALFAGLSEEETLPEGWQNLWRMGRGQIFSSEIPGEIHCRSCADVGIIQYPISLPLDEDLQLAWSWLLESLPSRLPESIQPTHDYLSIAVEFDNGLDLTYMWSAALPEGSIFQCPLPWWAQRETHWVLRSDPRLHGQWLAERRHLLDDYRRAIGGQPPARVVAVWLIANSVFQRGEGRCRYRDIVLESRETVHRISPAR